MQNKQSVALFLVLAFLLSIVPVALIKAMAEPTMQNETVKSELTLQTQLIGNSGATIIASDDVTAHTDNQLVTVTADGNKINVVHTGNEAGIANIYVSNGNETKTVQIPFGYTTFEFDGDKVTVFEGEGNKWEAVGINVNDIEYAEGDENYPLSVSYNESGNKVYENCDEYSININIKKKGGTYVFCGSTENMSISVNKAATDDAHILLAGLDMESSFTSPLTIKKESTARVEVTALEGYINTFSDNELNNADIYGASEDGGDETNSAYAESAVIKAKANSNIELNGKGMLNLVCNTKNAIKCGEYSSLTIGDINLNIKSQKHGISADNTIEINSGNIYIESKDDGIRTDPDAVDAENGTAGIVTINGGYFEIISGSDAIQAAQDIMINGGNFNIRTGNGYNDNTFNSDTMSCKGIKASSNADDENADTSDATNNITITGGTFEMNCADDAIHSDANITVTGGNYNIKTGDDAIHSDTKLIIGEENGDNTKINITVTNCYEGIESGTILIYSGTIRVTASDDGLNAAGGNDGSGGGGFNPWPGHGPGGGGGQPPVAGSFSISIYGGDIYLNTSSDAIDSNGSITISGGKTIVFGAAANHDGEPYDCDGTFTITGGIVFGAGSSQMVTTPRTENQAYISSRTTINSGKTINVKYNGNTVFNIIAVKNVNYVIFSSPDMTTQNGWSIVADNSELIDPTPTPTEMPTPSTTPSAMPTFEPTETPHVTTAPSQTPADTENPYPPASGDLPPEPPTSGELPPEPPTSGELPPEPPTSEEPMPQVFPGDANEDGVVNTGDAVRVLRYVVGTAILSHQGTMNADMNMDREVNTGDAVLILKMCAEQ